MEEKAKSKPEHLLIEAIGFSEEDLEANREGYMSEQQRRSLFRKWTPWTCFTLLFAALILPTMLPFVLEQLGTSTLSPLTLIAAVFLVVPVYFAYKWWQLSVDMRQRLVTSVEGRVRLDLSGGGNSSQLTVSIGKAKFHVKKPIFLAFKNGDPYCVYYAPRSKTILSAEWLRE